MQQRRRYYAERQGRGPSLEPLPFDTIRRLVMEIVDRFDAAGYLQEAFGFECVDAGPIDGTLGPNPAMHFVLAVGREQVWPFDVVVDQHDTKRWRQWDEDTLFDTIEVLHDLISRPKDGWEHDHNYCGWHWEQFDREAGQAEFRDELNRVLQRGAVPMEFDAHGQIVECGPAEFRKLIETAIPSGADDVLVRSKVDVAVAHFRSRNATRDERRIAVQQLAAALEALRPKVKETMLRADERALFQIANQFGIRHNDPAQMRDYDDLIWLTWMFYLYLATIHAVEHVIEKQRAQQTALPRAA